MSNRSKSPPPKSSRIVNATTSIDLPSHLIVNRKVNRDLARNMIFYYNLKHGNRISINNKLFYVNKDYDLEETKLAFGKTKKRKKVLKRTRRKKRGKK